MAKGGSSAHRKSPKRLRREWEQKRLPPAADEYDARRCCGGDETARGWTPCTVQGAMPLSPMPSRTEGRLPPPAPLKNAAFNAFLRISGWCQGNSDAGMHASLQRNLVRVPDSYLGNFNRRNPLDVSDELPCSDDKNRHSEGRLLPFQTREIWKPRVQGPFSTLRKASTQSNDASFDLWTSRASHDCVHGKRPNKSRPWHIFVYKKVTDVFRKENEDGTFFFFLFPLNSNRNNLVREL